MNNNSVIAVDLAKNIFQVCEMRSGHKITYNKQLKRGDLLAFISQQKPTTIVMEACYSSHYWAREFEQYGHAVKLLPAQHVTPFVRGNKSDKNDVIGIAEASLRPNIKAVPIKTLQQQDIQSLHRLRERHVTHRTGLINQSRGLLSEYGLIGPEGVENFRKQIIKWSTEENIKITPLIREQLVAIIEELDMHTSRIKVLTSKLLEVCKTNSLCQLLLSIPGIGVINATAIYSAIGNGCQFNHQRDLAVWLGLTPKQASSGKMFTSGGITKRGNRYLRKQLVHGARAVVSRAKGKSDRLSIWNNKIVERRGKQKAYVALAARLARTAWIVLQRQEEYQVKS